MGTGPRKGHFYGDQFLEKVIFMVNSPRKGHFYGDQSQKRSNNYWPEKNNYFYRPVFIFMGPILGNMIHMVQLY